MPETNLPKLRGRMNLTVHYSAIMALYWADYAVLLNYASVFLLGHGFRNSEIGILIAAAALVSALAQPLIGSYADKPRSPSVKTLLLAAVCMFLIVTILIPFSAAFSRAALFVTYALSAVVMQAMLSLTNSLGTMTARSGGNVDFGIARGVGSLAYAVTSLIIGHLTSRYGIALIPWTGVGVYVLFAVCVLFFPFQKQILPASADQKTGFLKKYPSFFIVLPAAVLLYSSHSMINNFMYQIIVSKGGDSASLGTAFAIAAVVELPVMFAFSRLLRRISAGKWLVISGFAFLAKSTGTLLVTGVKGFYGVQLLQLLAYAVITVASVYYTDALVEPQDAVKGQAYFAMTSTAGSVLGSAAGGFLIDARGISALLIVSIAFAAAGAVLMCRGIAGKKRVQSRDLT